METCSYFIENKALFGGYPNHKQFEELINNKVVCFVDLITKAERDNLNVYDTSNIQYMNYDIKDRFIPEDIYKFIKFIHKISLVINNLKDEDKIYIHCKGGHGRAGIIVSCLLCYLYKYSSDTSLELTNKYHNNRKTMKEKWRIVGSPQTDRQKEFIRRLFKPIYLDKIHLKNTYFPF